MSQTHSVKNLLSDEALIGSHVTVQGWLRSKRDSKAGISFLAVNDGSHLDSLPVSYTHLTLPTNDWV